jgi:Carboxypeptidase regulatory-like domain
VQEYLVINRQRHRIFTESLNVLIFLILILLPTYLCAATVSGTVKDPSGAVIPQATIEITGPQLGSPLKLVTDGQGRFTSEDLKPGDYVVRVAHEGFETLQQKISLTSSSELQFTLAIARQETQVTVPAQSMQFANSDPLYRELRSIGLGETFRLGNFTLKYDVGTFSFEKGTLTWLRPVQGVVTGAVFTGQGHFHLKAVTSLDTREIARRTGSDEVDEEFTQVIFRFNGEQRRTLLLGMGAKTEPSPDALKAFEHWRERARHRREVPLGFTDSLLDGDSMDNVDADVLAAVYNPNHPPFFNAYLRGVKHQDLRFFVRMRVGAIPQLDSPEEVALINFDPEGMSDGVWYLAHLRTEYEKGVASSQEDRRLFATLGYKIETVIAKNQHLFSSSTVTFKPLVEGERILKFGLLPTLRVTRVMDEQGQNLHFIQESRKEDGSFYVVLPQAASLGKSYAITIEYKGDKVLEQAGEGCFYVRARTSWYPNLNGFGEHSLYDLTFKVPKAYKVVSVGRLKDESIDGDIALTHWVTPIPVAVAGFNYGEYKKVEIADDITHYNVSGYYLPELPDNLRNYRALQSMAPSRMTKYALEQARAELQICTSFFGRAHTKTFTSQSSRISTSGNLGPIWSICLFQPIRIPRSDGCCLGTSTISSQDSCAKSRRMKLHISGGDTRSGGRHITINGFRRALPSSPRRCSCKTLLGQIGARNTSSSGTVSGNEFSIRTILEFRQMTRARSGWARG